MAQSRAGANEARGPIDVAGALVLWPRRILAKGSGATGFEVAVSDCGRLRRCALGDPRVKRAKRVPRWIERDAKTAVGRAGQFIEFQERRHRTLAHRGDDAAVVVGGRLRRNNLIREAMEKQDLAAVAAERGKIGFRHLHHAAEFDKARAPFARVLGVYVQPRRVGHLRHEITNALVG